MTSALVGIDRLLFISSQPGGAVSRETQHLNVVAAAKEAGVSLVAYTSYPKAGQAKAPLAHDHQVTEAAIKEAGLPGSPTLSYVITGTWKTTPAS